jgi:hypothetical protein
MERGGGLGISSKHLDPGSICDALLHPFGGERVLQESKPSYPLCR